MQEHQNSSDKGKVSPYSIQDPEEFAKNLLRVCEQGSKALSAVLSDNKGGGPWSIANEMGETGKVLGGIAQLWMRQPEELAAAQTKLSEDFVELWGRTYRRFLGESVEPLIKPMQGDSRFQDKDWTEKPLFDFWKQAYLLTSQWAETMVDSAPGADERQKQRARFNLNLLTSALSPSNFPFSNPEVLRLTASQNAENLVKGMTQLVQDLNDSGDLMRIRQTDMSAFAIGKNIAVSPGKVIFQNEIIQLIQYAPATENVYSIPLLIVPPWINKYYILDLVPEKSFIKWLVEQGFTVFLISWVNPDERLAHKTFEDYMHEGIMVAAEMAAKAAGVDKVNALGYCVGGTLLGTTLAYMAQKQMDKINAASFLAAQVDFAKAGDLLIFIDDAQIKALQQMMSEHGYLDGSRMAAVFNMLRPKDLIWPYIVNNYLLGKQPFPFDLLFWNSDSTRMPAANHSFYLNEFYNHNKLAMGQLEIGGVKLDLSKVMAPIYELATREDHIAPAQSVFRGAKLFGGPLRFVLGGSGHIAGVINPPAKKKYNYWTIEDTDNRAFAGVDQWLKAATEHSGSWWPDYSAWLAGWSGDKVPARNPGEGPLTPIEDAPGSYVKK
jgi:polyhydroxyalkanoate synthase